MCMIYCFGHIEYRLMSFRVLSSVERYDLATKKWTQVKELPEGRLGPSVVGSEGHLVVLGGCGLAGRGNEKGSDFVIHDSVIVYDPATDG